MLDQYRRYTETPPEVIEDVVNSAEAAYRTVGLRFGIDVDKVHKAGFCTDVVNEMGRNLCNRLDRDYQAAPLRASLGFEGHMLMSIIPPNSNRRIIADPTWQYGLPRSQRASYLPKVLLGTIDEVDIQLHSFGVSEERRGTWVSRR